MTKNGDIFVNGFIAFHIFLSEHFLVPQPRSLVLLGGNESICKKLEGGVENEHCQTKFYELMKFLIR